MIKFKDILSESKLGDCFDAAYNYVTRKDNEATLVHGFVSGQRSLSGVRYTHAWNEKGNDVIDNSNGRSIKVPKELYYAIGNIKESECKYYNIDQVNKMSLKFRHKGPWEIKNTNFKESKIREAIVDPVSDTLSDIFQSSGKLKPIVKNTIEKNIKAISDKFPEVEVNDYILVGAAATYQYDDRSDIDVSVFIKPDIDKTIFKQADKWIEANIDNKFYFGKRPYQFKLTVGNRNQLSNVESAFDVKLNKWIKEPDKAKTAELYKNNLDSPDSKALNLYKQIENLIQPSVIRLGKVLHSVVESSADDLVKQHIISAYNRYDKVIKPLRAKAFSSDTAGLPSQNWNTGNIIYKMLDREGYNSIYMMMKTMVKNDDYSTSNLQQLKTRIDDILPQEIGFVRKSNY